MPKPSSQGSGSRSSRIWAGVSTSRSRNLSSTWPSSKGSRRDSGRWTGVWCQTDLPSICPFSKRVCAGKHTSLRRTAILPRADSQAPHGPAHHQEGLMLLHQSIEAAEEADAVDLVTARKSHRLAVELAAKLR